MKKLITVSLAFCVLFSNPVLALEELDELELRANRRTSNTFYRGATSGNDYVRQPQTVIYTDTTTGNEMWLWTQEPNSALSGKIEYGWQPWSADGKRMSWVMTNESTLGCYSRNRGWPWLASRSDGTYIRPLCEGAAKTESRQIYFDWSPVEPDVFFHLGYNYNGNSDLDQNMIYKHSITDTSISYQSWVDLVSNDTATVVSTIKDGITGDGVYIQHAAYIESEPFYISQVYPSNDRKAVISYDQPELDTYWLNTPTGQDHYHDESFNGNSAHGYWTYILYTSGSWWRQRPWGSDGKAPDHVIDRSTPYSWWNADGQDPDELPIDPNKEIQPVNSSSGTQPDFFYDRYWSHANTDRWGTHAIYSDAEVPPYGPGIMDVNRATRTGYNSKVGGAQYHVWTAWSDYGASSVGSPPNIIAATKYNSTNNTDHITVGYTHSSTTGQFTKPGQSPDGTKIAMRSNWLQSSSTLANLFIGIPYFPYPPQINSVSGSEGTVSISFDWSSGKFTTRGWPHEDNDEPSPPRETDYFRLWRSPSGSDGTWTPLGTTDCTIWNVYNFANGTGDHNGGWNLRDTPGDGTWYYGVTAVEHSGLESRALSNVFSITLSNGTGTGSQSMAYPSPPGADSDFYANTFIPTHNNIVRYYNVYAEDGATPSVSQTNRIASISKNWASNGVLSWVDWLGNTEGNTNHVVTAVDTQGNESAGTYVTNVSSSHTQSPATAAGQYTIAFDDMYKPYRSGPETPGAPTDLRIVNGQ